MTTRFTSGSPVSFNWPRHKSILRRVLRVKAQTFRSQRPAATHASGSLNFHISERPGRIGFGIRRAGPWPNGVEVLFIRAKIALNPPSPRSGERGARCSFRKKVNAIGPWPARLPGTQMLPTQRSGRGGIHQLGCGFDGQGRRVCVCSQFTNPPADGKLQQ